MTFRIGNAGGFWGDDPFALRRQLLGPQRLDVIAIDFLAEVTMSIMQKQRAKDPSAGYARDFVAQVAPLLPELVARGTVLVTNAGGVNPRACAEALKAAAGDLELRVAIVEGDDLAARMPELRDAGADFRNMETGEAFASVADRVQAANAYFGARPVAEAMKHRPHIVLCGRVTDTGLTLGPLIHAFGWSADGWGRLAAGIVAGHILECGAQATGGNFTDWQKVPSFLEPGYPIAEVEPDGTFVITKQPGSGGLVSCQTVREQLLYEMGDPQAYLTPDVIADFSTIQLEADGPDRVRVSGIQGRPPTDLLKVSLAHTDGWKVQGAIFISGPGARAKARAFSDLFWARFASERERLGLPEPEAISTEHVGDDAAHRGLTPPHEPTEILLRLGARGYHKPTLELFRKLLPALILSGPPGVAIAGGAPLLSDVVSYWPALMPQALAPAFVVTPEGTRLGPLDWLETGGKPEVEAPVEDPACFADVGPTVRVPLGRIAHARSGDKGDMTNIGLIGRSEACYAWMRDHVTAERAAAWFRDTALGGVTRFTVPNLWALNFLLEGSLGGGGTKSLFLDAQGKTLSHALLRCEVEVPEALLWTIAPENAPCA